MRALPVKVLGSFSKILIAESARMSAFRQFAGVPRPQLMVAYYSIMVAGQSALAATLCSRTSAARPWAMRVMPNLEIE